MSAHTSESLKVSLITRYSVRWTHLLSDMIGIVIKEERHLLSDEELALLTVFAHLSCMSPYPLPCTYLLTRER